MLVCYDTWSLYSVRLSGVRIETDSNDSENLRKEVRATACMGARVCTPRLFLQFPLDSISPCSTSIPL